LLSHFRSKYAGSLGQRIDAMATLRGIDSFKELWRRRTTLLDPEIRELNLLSLLDLCGPRKCSVSLQIHAPLCQSNGLYHCLSRIVS
jgi:hypothetical protein